MAYIPVNVDVRDLQVVVSKFNVPMAESLQIVGAVLTTRIDDLIQSEGARGTEGPWEPFSPVTFKIHPDRRGGSLLQASGQLASMQTTMGTSWVQVGSPAPYAEAHITGVLENPIDNLGPIPSRDFLAIDMGRALDEAAGLVAERIVVIG